MQGRRKRARHSKGFTLVELLIALMVFSVITTFAYRSVNLLASARNQLELEQVALSDLQKTLLIWERDIRQQSPNQQPLKLSDTLAQEGEQESEDEVLLVLETLASGGLVNGVPRLMKVTYSYKDGVLLREATNVGASAGTPVALMTGLTEVEMSLGLAGTPDVVSLLMLHESLGTVQRLIHVSARDWSDVPADPLSALNTGI